MYTSAFLFLVTLFTRQQIGLEYLFIVIETFGCASDVQMALQLLPLGYLWMNFIFISSFRFCFVVVLCGFSLFFSLVLLDMYDRRRLGQLEMEINSANRYYIIILCLLFSPRPDHAHTINPPQPPKELIGHKITQ